MKILLASNNKHKIYELKEIFKLNDLMIELISPKDLKIEINPNEIGSTFEQNSRIKAREFYSVAKIPVIADDSGLEVDCLNGQPGVDTANYAGYKASDAANRKKLLDTLQGESNRQAQFVCNICFFDGLVEKHFVGTCHGYITIQELGKGGFGYDPVFKPQNYNISFAQLSPEIKNKISHRAIATKNLIDFLKNYTNIS